MLIGIIGKKRSGKDTISDYLVQNYNFNKYSFADPIREICQLMFNFSDDQLNTYLKDCIDNRWNITPRDTLQILGTEFARNMLHEKLPNINVNKGEFWIKKFQIWYLEQLKINPNIKIVVSDVRFLDEYKCITDLGGKFIKVTRNTNILDEHISELELDNLDSNKINYIDNNKSIEDLKSKIREVIE